jgi:hypothetical protein
MPDFYWDRRHRANQILAQPPDATRVVGYRTWQALGRQVTRGERHRHPRPITYRATAEDDSDRTGLDGSAVRRLAGFKVEHVWDISQGRP